MLIPFRQFCQGYERVVSCPILRHHNSRRSVQQFAMWRWVPLDFHQGFAVQRVGCAEYVL